MLKFQYGQSEGASTSHLFHAGQDPSATASSRVRVRVESRRHRRQKSLAEQTGRFHQRMVPNFFEPVQALASRPTYPPPGDEWPIVPVGRRSVDLEQNPNSPSSVPTGEDLGSTRSAWGDRTEFMWTPGHEYSDIVTDDEQSLPTIGGGLQSLFGARTAGTSTLELIDLGLASTTSLDPRSPNSFSVRTLPPRIVRNSAWQFMFLTICLFTDMETLIGLPARIYFNGRGAFFLVYLVFLFSLTLSLAFFQCTVGQYHQDGLVKLFQESPIGIGLGLGVSTTLMLVANQKMMYLARTYQTLLPLLSGAFRDPVTCSEDVCVENQPQSLEIESNCLETTDLSSLDGQSCPETTTVRWSQLQDWTVFSSSSSSLDFGFIIHGDIILPSQGIAETLYVILGHIILECLGLCQIGYFFHYGMTYVRENLKYLIGCPLPRWTLVSFLLFDFAVLLSLLIYNFFGSVATFLTTKTSLSWVGWVGNGFAGLAVLIMWTPVCLGLFHAKINRKSLHAVISAVKSLGSKDPTESANGQSATHRQKKAPKVLIQRFDEPFQSSF